MKRYTPEELAEVLRLHQIWLQNEEGGVRANLAGANLDGANLAGANLDGANLVRAKLDGANLDGANLDGANLDGANLVRANLDGDNLVRAYLVRANLAGANLVRAKLDGANLAGANLAGAKLDGANLDGANLDGANLDGAKLDGAKLAGAKGFKPFVCIGPIGSRRGHTTAYLLEDKVICGCFNGTLEAFEAKVKKTHANNPLHLAEYLALVPYIKALREAQPPCEATPEPPAPFMEGQTAQLTEAGRKHWPWAPIEVGEVRWCRGGWTGVEFNACFLSIPDAFVEQVEDKL